MIMRERHRAVQPGRQRRLWDDRLSDRGFELRLVSEDGVEASDGEIGELHVKGPTSALGYWCNREKTQATFLGDWVRTGDKFTRNADGRYVYCGRSDDMLKVSGIYVSPLRSNPLFLPTRPSQKWLLLAGTTTRD